MIREVDGDLRGFKDFKKGKNEATLMGKRRNAESSDESSGGD